MKITGSKEEIISYLEAKSCDIRKKYVEYVSKVGRSHVGGCLSMCDVTVSLFYQFMHWDICKVEEENRDRFILSKGHCSELLYIIYADMGWCDHRELVQERLRVDGALSTHADKRYLPMIEVGTGALGHGLPIAAGYAHAGKIDNRPYKVICLVGDGELDEGSNWEAMMYAAHNKLGNLIMVVDRNLYSSCKNTEEVIKLNKLSDKFLAFGWEVVEINGNDMNEIYDCFNSIYRACRGDKPIAVISNTIKGYGLPTAMECPWEWHNREITNELLGECK